MLGSGGIIDFFYGKGRKKITVNILNTLGILEIKYFSSTGGEFS